MGSALVPPEVLERLLTSSEPEARWVALVELADRPADHPDARAAHDAVLSADTTEDLLRRVVPPDVPQRISGHDAPTFTPNLLHLLADRGVGPADDERFAAALDGLMDRADVHGRPASFVAGRGGDDGRLSVLACDSLPILDILVRFGRRAHPRVETALGALAADLASTPQGTAWPCRPDPASGFRGPGRKADCCPMATVVGVRLFSRLPADDRPSWLGAAAGTLLDVWVRRGLEHPYMFGHGRRFKTVKWPPTWYSALAVLDAVGRVRDVWDGPAATAGHRRATVELAACLAAYNLADGAVTPQSARRGFELHSFGRKGAPSDWATARVLVVLRRLEALAAEVAAIDVLSLGSSVGGTGAPQPPRAVPRD